MQSAEEFMREFFHARTVEIKSELDCRRPFRRKFFSDGCRWDSRKGTVERSQAETILSVSKSGDEVRVITREIAPFPKLCYHLRRLGESWLIHHVDIECTLCNGNPGNDECPSCLGKGWLCDEDYAERIKRIKLRSKKRKDIPPFHRR